MPNGRIPIDTSVLFQLVATAVQARVTSQDTFTAYDVTQQLRADGPQLEIDHNEVRQAVRVALDPVLQSGAYDAESRPTASGRDALHFYPVAQTAPANPSTVAHTLPLVSDGTTWGNIN